MSEQSPEERDPPSGNIFAAGLAVFGPIAAGFNVGSYILGFFGAGALARWLIEHWFPFTRWAWGQLLQILSLPEITESEKDALTTLVFFAPLGLWALLFGRSSAGRAHGRLHGGLLQAAGVITGILFLSVVGWNFIVEFAGVATETLQQMVGGTLLYGILIACTAISLSFVAFIEIKDRRKNRRTDMPTLIIIVFLFAFSLIFFAAAAQFLILSSSYLGPIKALALLGILVLGGLASILTPYRLMVALGVVICFVSAGLIFELGVLFIDFIESVTPNSTDSGQP
ncbi:MAG: hypothetical protein AAGF44_07930 [Pseudomonadota bacterium]